MSKYPVSEEEYVHAVQEYFKRTYPTFEKYFDMLYDERVIEVIKEGYEQDCWSYDNGQTQGDYFNVNNPILGNSVLPALELAVEFPEYLDDNTPGDKMNLENKLEECERLYNEENYEGLIRKCDEILEEFPDNQNATGYKGFSYYALGDDDKALEILERGVELYPNNYYLKNNLAMVYYALGDYETSLKLCEEGLEIRDFEWLCENKFKNLIRLDRYDEAIEFEKSIDHDLSLHLIFMEEDMSEHELNYCYHLLKEKPDDKFLIGMIKMISEKLGKTPDIEMKK